ncbi:GNAT family N-acetyltransferase [Nocardia testacea]|uniref:GNAT family N-acetyltransferase n=1 Tax=Nocardia testacea TaxID=248551 RepID=UPI003A8BB531
MSPSTGTGPAGDREAACCSAEGCRCRGVVRGLPGRAAGGAIRLLHGDDPRIPEMKAVWVSRDARGGGIGDQLMATTLTWARQHDCSAVTLWVRENNEHAKNLYLRNGFRPTGESRPHFSESELRSIEMRNDLA